MRIDGGPFPRESISNFLIWLPAGALCENVEAPLGSLRNFAGPKGFRLRTDSVLRISDSLLGPFAKRARGA